MTLFKTSTAEFLIEAFAELVMMVSKLSKLDVVAICFAALRAPCPAAVSSVVWANSIKAGRALSLPRAPTTWKSLTRSAPVISTSRA